MTKRNCTALWVMCSLGIVAVMAAWAHKAGYLADPTAVAVVDMDTLQGGLDELRQLEADLDAGNAEFREQILAMEEELQALGKRLDEEGATMQTDQRSALLAEVMRLRARIDSDREILGNLFQFNAHQLMSEVYPRIYEGIAQVAERDGWDIVLLDTSKIDVGNTPDFASMNNAVARRSVLYVNSRVDITADVTTLLNNAFNAGAVPADAVP